MIQLVQTPIAPQPLIDFVTSTRAGAVVLFLGTVRELTGERQTASLDYECYPAMAEAKLAGLEAEARSRWPIIECALVHRLGHLEPSEASVAVVVSTPHRRDAFAAAEWLMDTIKSIVPIWKKENWADGTHEWVHPKE